jgi:hypothetical protein
VEGKGPKILEVSIGAMRIGRKICHVYATLRRTAGAPISHATLPRCAKPLSNIPFMRDGFEHTDVPRGECAQADRAAAQADAIMRLSCVGRFT